MFRFLNVTMFGLSIATIYFFVQTKNLLMLVLAILSILLFKLCLIETKNENEALKTEETKEQAPKHIDIKI